MILRFYRLTDKLGIFILKLGAAVADWLTEGSAQILGVFGRLFGGIWTTIVWVVMLIISGVMFIVQGISRLIGFAVPQVTRASSAVAQRGSEAMTKRRSEAMARQVARDEIDVIMKEDPLKTQNRRLSFLVLILGVSVLAAVIWATDPSRTLQAVPVAPVADNSNPVEVVADPTQDGLQLVAPTAIPTATPLPEALSARGAIAYTTRERGQTDIWAVNVGSRTPIRITNNVADERDPEWNADGTRLAFSARNNGSWDLFVYEAVLNEFSQVTVDVSFQANPSWSPDGTFLAYENYQNDNLDIYALPIDGSDSPRQITTDPSPDFSPAWGPGGREIAFVSLRDGNKEIYVISLEDFSLTNITNTPDVDEDYPAWSPDGRSIAYSALEPQAISETVYIQSLDDLGTSPELVAVGRAPTFAPDGTSIAYAVDTRDGTRTDIFATTIGAGSLPILISSVLPDSTAPSWTLQPLPASLVNAGGLPIGVDEALYIEQIDEGFDGNQYQLRSLGNVQTDQAFLSDAVNDSFDALRQTVFEQTNLDYLGVLDDAFWRLERPADFGEPGRNWHRTGRTFAVPRTGLQGFPPRIEVVRENIGNEVYWRVFVRVDEETQRGQLGEPLRDIPWDFLSTEDNVDAYETGGRLRREIPSGYYVDFTEIASDYDWQRQPAGSDWIANQRARNFWLYIHDDNFSWCDAMLQLYSEGELINYGCAS